MPEMVDQLHRAVGLVPLHGLAFGSRIKMDQSPFQGKVDHQPAGPKVALDEDIVAFLRLGRNPDPDRAQVFLYPKRSILKIILTQ
jgi:hypothetical protein